MTYDGITYDGFYYEAGQFFKLLENSTFEQAENGFKALQLMMLVLPDDLNARQKVSIDAIHKLAARKLAEHPDNTDQVVVKGIQAMNFLKAYAGMK